jgi:hypothetical protein
MPDRLTLPPLPEPARYFRQFSSAQLLADRAAVWRCAMEAAARECEKQKRNWEGPFYRCAEVLAAALRALPVPGDKPSTVESQR